MQLKLDEKVGYIFHLNNYQLLEETDYIGTRVPYQERMDFYHVQKAYISHTTVRVSSFVPLMIYLHYSFNKNMRELKYTYLNILFI